MFYHFPNVDHHLTTTVQPHRKMPKKPVVTTNKGLFLVSGSTVQNQQNLRFNASLYRPVVVFTLLRHRQRRQDKIVIGPTRQTTENDQELFSHLIRLYFLLTAYHFSPNIQKLHCFLSKIYSCDYPHCQPFK